MPPRSILKPPVNRERALRLERALGVRFTGGFASINLGGIACLFVIGGALGMIFYAMQKK